MKKVLALVLSAVMMLGLGACGSPENEEEAVKEESITEISLSDDGISVKGSGAEAEGSVVKINAGGSYKLRGRLSDGQLIVDTGDAPAKVKIILSGADITNTKDSAILIKQAENTRIELAQNSENFLSSGEEGREYGENAQGAVIYSEDDLDIEGSGSLSIKGYINNGILCKDDLDINEGEISVYAVNNGVKASESIELKGGNLVIEAGNEGMKTSSAKKEGKGYVEISDGSLSINSGDDGIKAIEAVKISGGVIKISAGGDGIQAGVKDLNTVKSITVSGGELFISAKKFAFNGVKTDISRALVLALQNKTEGSFKNAGSQSFIYESFSGSKGSSVSAGASKMTAENDYTEIIYSAPELTAGEEYAVSSGGTEFKFIAK